MLDKQGPVCVIIPARGGSKGIPGKNLREVGGTPLVGRTVSAAVGAACVHRVIVSTDDAAIAAVAGSYGAEIISRPAEIAGDTVGSEAALLHALSVLARLEGYAPEILVFMQCTSPFTEAGDVEASVNAILENRADTTLTAYRAHLFLWRSLETGGFDGVNHSKLVRPMRQQRQPEFVENGAVYAMRCDGFLQNKHRFFGRSLVVEMPAVRSIEIDEPSDLIMAEALHRTMPNVP